MIHKFITGLLTILVCGTIGAEPPESVRVNTSVGEYIVSVYGYPDFEEYVPRSLLQTQVWYGYENRELASEFAGEVQASLGLRSACLNNGENWGPHFAWNTSGWGIGIANSSVWACTGSSCYVNDGTDLCFRGNFSAIAEPVPSVAIPRSLREPFECDGVGVGEIVAEANAYADDDDPFETLDWYLDGVFIDQVSVGSTLPISVPLGDHTLKVVGRTQSGVEDDNEVTVTVQDTTPPTVQASLSPGAKKNRYDVSIVSSDICDPDPMFTSVAGVEVMDGQSLEADKKSGALYIPSNDLSLTIIATDASGNTTEEQVQLQQ